MYQSANARDENIRLILWASVLGLVCALAPDLVGAKGQVMAKESDQSEEVAELDRVVVTATRANALLEDTPMAVAVLGEDELTTPAQGLGMDEWLNQVPGLFFQNRYNFAQNIRISIRGFGARAPFGVRGIQILNDGFPETLPDGQAQVDAIDLTALKKAEIIRGPSSALYGNASGGLISFQTQDGEGRQRTLQTQLDVGSDGFRRVGVQAGQDAGTWHGWLSVSDLEYTGQRDHSGTNKRLLNANVGLRLGDGNKLRLVASVLDQPFGQDAGALTKSQVTQDRWQASAQAESLNAGQTVRQDRVGLRLDQNITSDHNLSTYAFRTHRDFSQQLPSSFFPSLIAYQRDFVGTGAVLQWEISPAFGLTTGLDWAKQEDDRQRYRVDRTGSILEQTQLELQTAKSRAVFVQATGQWNNWSYQIGARRDSLALSIDDQWLAGLGDARRTYHRWSAMGGIRYALTPNMQVYANAGDGFESPTFTEIKDLQGGAGFARDLDPAQSNHRELGFRSQLEKSKLEASVFWTKTKDEIVIGDAFDGVDIYTNAGQTKRRGVEFSLDHSFDERLSLNLAYTWAHYQFSRFRAEGISFDGNRLPGLPRHSAYLQWSYRWTDNWSVFLDGLWVGKVFADNANTVPVSDYGLVNAKAQFGLEIGRMGSLEWSFGVTNLLDKPYFSNVRVNANAGAYFEPGPGRAWFSGWSIRC